MAKLKTTYVSGGLYVTGSENFVSASEFRGDVVGTASVARNLDPTADLRVKTLDVSGSAIVGGDLKVLGDLTYVGVKDLRVKDKVIEVNTDDSGSAVASADGAGIVIKNSDPEGDISILYSKDSDRLVFNKQIAGKIDEAVKVSQSLTLQLTDAAGTASADVVFDGAAPQTFSVDLSTLETKTHASASVADLQDQIDAISGGGTGSIDSKIQAAIETLNADASVAASGTPAHDGVFVLSGVAINEVSGKLTSGSATSVEVEQAGAAAAAKAELLGADTDETSSMTLYGVKKYAAAQASDGITNLSSSVATDFSASAAAQATYSQSTYLSISESNAARVALSESVASSSNAFSASVAADFTANASASSAALNDFSASVATDFENIGSGSSAAVTTLSESVANDFSASNARVAALSESFETHVSASSAALSDFSASVALDFSASAADLNGFSASVATDFSRSAASQNDFSASVASDFETVGTNIENVAATASAELTAASQSISQSIAAVASASADAYVAKAGDTMTGDLNMASNKIKFGDMYMVWDSTNECINFVAEEE